MVTPVVTPTTTPATTTHPTSGRPFTEMVYQPMLELLDYLRANGFKTFIVSGGGIEFMRPWSEQVYGIPPEQVIGSSIKTEYKVVDGQPVLVRLGVKDQQELRDGFPQAPDELFAYDAVILDDLEADFFSPDQMLLLRRFVSQRGGGLLMLGGLATFDNGGYDHGATRRHGRPFHLGLLGPAHGQ